MKLLMHGIELRRQYLVDAGELVAVPAVNARSAYLTLMPGRDDIWQELVLRKLPMVYQTDDAGQLIAVYD